MGSAHINFYFDAVFVRSPGSQFATPWHQDEPYWSVEGYDTCTIWMPLVPVKRENALAYVPGSHRIDSVFYQYNFGNLNPDGKTGIDQVDFSGVVKDVSIMLVPGVAPGDHVLVHVGFAINLLSEEEAAETLRLIREISDLEEELGPA